MCWDEVIMPAKGLLGNIGQPLQCAVPQLPASYCIWRAGPMAALADSSDNCRMMQSMPTTAPPPAHTPSRAVGRLRTAALVFVFLWFALGGVAHFALTELEMRIVP